MVKRLKRHRSKADIARSNRKAGRRNENLLADLLGFDRAGAYGSEDAKHPLFSAEFKKKKVYSGASIMRQAITNCPEGKIPLVVVHVTGSRREEDIVHMRLEDWLKLGINKMTKEI